MDATPSTSCRRGGADEGTPIPMSGRVLLVEDNEHHRIVFEAMFYYSTYHVDIVAGGAAALARFRAARYDLILMDLHMPEMDGFETTMALRAWERSLGLEPTLIVALTASVMPEQLAASREAGCDGHIAKPIGRRALLQAIDALIGPRPG